MLIYLLHLDFEVTMISSATQQVFNRCAYHIRGLLISMIAQENCIERVSSRGVLRKMTLLCRLRNGCSSAPRKKGCELPKEMYSISRARKVHVTVEAREEHGILTRSRIRAFPDYFPQSQVKLQSWHSVLLNSILPLFAL